MIKGRDQFSPDFVPLPVLSAGTTHQLRKMRPYQIEGCEPLG
jgi:hypothetical protein